MRTRGRSERTIAGRTEAAFLVGIVASVLLAALPPVSAATRPGTNEAISVSPAGGTGNAGSDFPWLTSDGRSVLFRSRASDLSAGDTNGVADLFVRDRQTGETELVSLASDGSQGNADAGTGALSNDGRIVAFSSRASNLVPGDTNGAEDVFVRDRATGLTERISVSAQGEEGDAFSTHPVVTPDGRYVAFDSCAQNLVPNDTSSRPDTCDLDVFVHDLATSTLERVSVVGPGIESNASGHSPCISGDGRFVAFEALGPMEDADTNAADDIYVRDREQGLTERVSAASDGTEGGGNTSLMTIGTRCISEDGRFVTFASSASNLVPHDTNGSVDVFVHDRSTSITERISLASDGRESAPTSPALPFTVTSSAPTITPDGRYVAYTTGAGNFAAGDDNGVWDIYITDRATLATERVSVAADGGDTDSSSNYASVSEDGSLVAFRTGGSNLVPGDENDSVDVFLRHRGPPVGVGGLEASVQGSTVLVSGWAGFAGSAIASTADPAEGGAGVEQAGADLVGASLVHRPDEGDLVARLPVSHLPGRRPPFPGACTTTFWPCPPSLGGASGVLYGFELVADGVRYEARASRDPADPKGSRFALFGCDPECVRVATVSGGLGTSGDEVRIAIPLHLLGTASGLTGIRAFTAVGDEATGALRTLDEAVLPDADLLAPLVGVGFAPEGTPESQVDLAPVPLEGAEFQTELDAAAASPGRYDLWARACLGSTCGARRVTIELT